MSKTGQSALRNIVAETNFDPKYFAKRKAEFLEQHPQAVGWIADLRKDLIESHQANQCDNPADYADYFIGEVLRFNDEIVFGPGNKVNYEPKKSLSYFEKRARKEDLRPLIEGLERELESNKDNYELVLILANAYRTGFGADKGDGAKAFKILEKVIFSGSDNPPSPLKKNPSILYEYASFLENGVNFNGLQFDRYTADRRARPYYGDAGNAGNVLASHMIEHNVFGRKEFTHTLFRIADCYMSGGWGVECDSTKAMSIYSKMVKFYNSFEAVPLFYQTYSQNDQQYIQNHTRVQPNQQGNTILTAAEIIEVIDNMADVKPANAKVEVLENILKSLRDMIEVSAEVLTVENLREISQKLSTMKIVDMEKCREARQESEKEEVQMQMNQIFERERFPMDPQGYLEIADYEENVANKFVSGDESNDEQRLIYTASTMFDKIEEIVNEKENPKAPAVGRLVDFTPDNFPKPSPANPKKSAVKAVLQPYL